MKKAMKVFLILSPCLILVGIALCFIGVRAGGSTHFGFDFKTGFVDFNKDEDGQKVEAERQTLEAFDTVSVDVDCMDVEVVEGEEYAVEYRAYHALGFEKLKCESKNGVLTFVQGGNSSSFPFHFEVNLDFLNWFTSHNKWNSDSYGYYVRIYVPEGTTLQDIKVDSDLGETVIRNVAVDGDVKIDADCGSIELENVTVSRNCRIESSLGAVDFTNCTLTDAEIELDCGDFEGKEITVLDKLKIDNSLGSIDLFMKGGLNSQTYRYDCDTDLGSVELAGEDCGSKAKGGSGTAEIILQNDCGSITLE